jgi:hypothetical protein
VFARALGIEREFEMLSVNEWTQHLLCADRYARGRVFIAGDAAHLMIPTGGLGMNTGIGDVADLGWKLAASLAGWGGPGLLQAYESERRPIGLRNVRASGEAMRGRDRWRQAEAPADMARLFAIEQRRVTEILGVEAGYRYVDSPLIWPESGEAPDPDGSAYVPTTWPGARLPHVWLEDGGALHDRLGPGYTLLRLAPVATHPLEAAFRSAGAPLDVLAVDNAVARELYERDLVLVRPDLHVVWRGNALPEAVDELVAVATGNAGNTAGRRRRVPLPPTEGGLFFRSVLLGVPTSP